MRFLLTLIIWLATVGGLWCYERLRAEPGHTGPPQPVVAAVDAAEDYSLLVTTTFSLEPDPFALQTDDAPAAPLELRLNGVAVPVESERLQRGRPWTLEKVEGLVRGHNEIYLQASPPLEESELAQGVRIKLVRGGDVVVDRTLWSEQGALVAGSVHFQLESSDTTHEH